MSLALAQGDERRRDVPRRFGPAKILAQDRSSGVSCIVLVQMSYYGTDNSYMLDVMTLVLAGTGLLALARLFVAEAKVGPRVIGLDVDLYASGRPL